MIGALKDCVITRGWAYQKLSDGTQMIMSEFVDSFFSMILDIQQDLPGTIAPDIDIINDYGLSRSESQCATTRYQYAKAWEDAINWMNRWGIRKEDVVNGPICVVYSEHKQMLDTFLVFSLPLWRLLWGFAKSNCNLWQYY